MPIFKFQCLNCGLQFKKSLSVAKKDSPTPCKSCKEAVVRQGIQQVNAVFCKDQRVDSPTPQNTGVSSVDVDYDLIIGRSADLGWKFQEDRKRVKTKVAHDNKVHTSQLSKNPDGSWAVMSDQTRKRTEELRMLNHIEQTRLEEERSISSEKDGGVATSSSRKGT